LQFTVKLKYDFAKYKTRAIPLINSRILGKHFDDDAVAPLIDAFSPIFTQMRANNEPYVFCALDRVDAKFISTREI